MAKTAGKDRSACYLATYYTGILPEVPTTGQ